MKCVLHDDLAEFVGLVGPIYRADPDRHTVALTVLDSHLDAGDPLPIMLTVEDGRGAVVGALVRSPGRAALVSGVPAEHAAAAVAAIVDAGRDVGGASGPVAEVEAFGSAWSARTGQQVGTALESRMFALGTLVRPARVPGSARRATSSDIDLLAEWRAAFVAEEGRGRTDPLSPREVAARALRMGTADMLWERDGVAVSFASARSPVAGMSRIGPVYTPPEHRRRGYAAAVTAAASQWALDAGAGRVLLFTDLANPTTNALYPRLGYRPVHDAREVTFVP